MNNFLDLEQAIKDLENRQNALKIKIHQSKININSIDSYIEKNKELLLINKKRLILIKKEDFIDLEDVIKIKQNIVNITDLMNTQIDRKTVFVSNITSANQELEQIKKLINDLKEELDLLKCKILEF